MKKILFLGTPEVAGMILKRLAGECEVVAVVTGLDRPAGRGKGLKSPAVKVVAEELGLPVWQPGKVSWELEKVRSLGAEMAVVVAYGEILSEEFLNSFPQGCVNVHFSLLPQWRGASPVQSAILVGDEVTGVTVQQMVKKLDAGDVLLQDKMKIKDDDTTAKLLPRLAEQGAELVTRVVRGEGKAVKQDEDEVTFCGKIEKADGELRFVQETAEELDRRRRAFDPWPGVWTVWRGERLKILDTAVSEEKQEAGLVEWRGEKLLVGARMGTLEIKKLQKAGKKPMVAADFVRGYPDFKGSKLPS